jgi:hypothetical protein
MARTAIGLFDNQAKAEQVRNELLRSGFTADSVLVLSEPRAMAEPASSHFTTLNIGGVPPDDEELFWEGVRRGGALVACTSTDRGADQAAQIMNRHGALDTEERAQEWTRTGWSRQLRRAAGHGLEPVYPADEAQTGRERAGYGGARVFVW